MKRFRRLNNVDQFSSIINPLYIRELFIEVCNYHDLNHIVQLCRLSKYHQNIIKTDRFTDLTIPMGTKSINRHNISYLLGDFNFANLDLSGSCLKNEHLPLIKNCTNLNICNTSVDRHCLKLLTGTYNTIRMDRNHLKRICYYSDLMLINNEPQGDLNIINTNLINAQDDRGCTILIYLLDIYHDADYLKSCVKFLIKHGINLDALNDKSYNALYYAVIHDNIKMVKRLLKAGANPNIWIQSNDIVLSIAIVRKYFDIAELLITYGADCDHMQKLGWTPLITSIDAHSYYMTELLISKGANVNAIFDDDWTPLKMAILHDDIKTVQLLLDKGANALLTRGSQILPLIQASEARNIHMIDLLLKYKVDINCKNSKGMTALFTSVILKDNFKIIKHLIKKGADVNVHDNCNGNLLLSMIFNNVDIKTIMYMIKRGLDINEADNKGINTLIAAMKPSNNYDVIDYLIKGIADINHTDIYKQNALMHALDNNRMIRVVSALIENGANINQIDIYGQNPLMIALYANRHSKIINYLIKHGADINYINEQTGKTILMAAIETNADDDVLTHLITNCNNLDHVASEDTMTALVLAMKKDNSFAVRRIIPLCKNLNNSALLDNSPIKIAIKNYKAVTFQYLTLLLNNGSDINFITNGTTPLIYAIKTYPVNLSLVEFLLENKADPNIKCDVNGKYMGALMHAINLNSNYSIISALIDNGADTKEEGILELALADLDLVNIVVKLLQCGTDYSTLDDDSWLSYIVALNEQRYNDGATMIEKIVFSREVV